MNTPARGPCRLEEPGQEKPLSLSNRFFTYVAIFLPPLGLIASVVYWWGHAVSSLHLTLAAAFYFITGFGITVGFHRLFTHRSFEAARWLKVALGIAGSMAMEGSLFDWCAWHGYHHEWSDTENDQHSPHHSGKGFWGIAKGLLHAQVGWIFSTRPPSEEQRRRYIPHLINDPELVFVNKYFPCWVILSLLLPTFSGGLLEQSWKGAILGFLWGGAVRIFLVHHVTWSINSICHMWGDKEYETGDQSRDNLLCTVVGLGEGAHNSHHKFRYSALHALRQPWLDASYLLIKLLEKCGAAERVLVPSALEIETKRLKNTTKVA